MPKYNNTILILRLIFVVMMTFFSHIEAWPKTQGSKYAEACVAERFTVTDSDVAETLLSFITTGAETKEESIGCLDTSKITNMESLFDVDNNDIFEYFDEEISCWDTSGVTTMFVGILPEYTYD